MTGRGDAFPKVEPIQEQRAGKSEGKRRRHDANPVFRLERANSPPRLDHIHPYQPNVEMFHPPAVSITHVHTQASLHQPP